MENPQWQLVSSEPSCPALERPKADGSTVDGSTVNGSTVDRADLEAEARELGRRLGQVDRIRPPDDPDPAIALFGQIDTFAELLTPAVDLDSGDATWPGPIPPASVDPSLDAASQDPPFRSAAVLDRNEEPLGPSTVDSATKRSVTDDLIDRLRRHRTAGFVALTIAFIAALLIGGMASDPARSVQVDGGAEAVAAPTETQAGAPAAPTGETAPTTPSGTLVVRRQPVAQRGAGDGSDRSSGEVETDERSEGDADRSSQPAADAGDEPGPGPGSDRIVLGEAATDGGPTATTTPDDPRPNRPTIATTNEGPTSTRPATSVRPSSTTAPAVAPTSTTTPRATSTSTVAPTTARPTTTTAPTTTTTTRPAPANVISTGSSWVGIDVDPGHYLSRPIDTICEVIYFDINGIPIAANTFLPGDHVHLVLIWSNWVWLGSTCPERYDQV